MTRHAWVGGLWLLVSGCMPALQGTASGTRQSVHH